ncbi:MAG TPA: hypothetical protein VK876_00150, partial [Rubrivivax sp.]|nr:hypothetical protein [Rubrivivax sp.]
RRHDGGWDRPHPWLQQTEPSTFGYGTPGLDTGAAAQGDGVPQPYFQTPGATRVGAQLAVNPQRLREQQQFVLRQALVSSLHGLTDALAALPSDEARPPLALAETAAAQLAEARQQAGAGTLASWADAQPVPALLALERALVQAGMVWSPADPRHRRLTHDEARQAIAGLSEVQLVVEGILGAEWENWGAPRWLRNPRSQPRPEPCLAAHSLQGGLAALQGCAPPSVASAEEAALWDRLGALEGEKGEKFGKGAKGGKGVKGAVDAPAAGAGQLVMRQFSDGPEAWVYLERRAQG